MLVGYSVDRTNDVYLILNLNTKRIIQTRDAFWKGKGYNDWRSNKSPSNNNDTDKDIGDSMERLCDINTKGKRN
jgi:hypothetical protein